MAKTAPPPTTTALESYYYTLENPHSLGSVAHLCRTSDKKKADVEEWLRAQDAYTLHKTAKRKFRRRKTFVPGINHLWQLDLVDLSSLHRYNDGYKFLLTCVDCFSRYAYAEAVRTKGALDVKCAFERILDVRANGLRHPTCVQTDKGREFLNAIFLSFLRERDIHHYTSENDDIKCALVERFNRTLKSKMWKYFTYSKSYRYVDVLDKLLRSYNDSYHTSIKMAPSKVDRHNEANVRRVLYSSSTTDSSGRQQRRRRLIPNYKFIVGDTVRISKKSRGDFDKGYEQQWQKEIFKVSGRYPTDPPTYKLIDYAGQEIAGKFYAEEIQKVKKDVGVFDVEKILRTRRRRDGSTEYLVRWAGYSSKHDSWVKDLVR